MGKQPTKSWHKEDIKAEIRKRGYTLTDLALDKGLFSNAVRTALIQPCYPGEQAIAECLGIPASRLWPERYDEQGTPLHPRVRSRLKRSREAGNRHRQKGEAA